MVCRVGYQDVSQSPHHSITTKFGANHRAFCCRFFCALHGALGTMMGLGAQEEEEEEPQLSPEEQLKVDLKTQVISFSILHNISLGQRIWRRCSN